MITWEQHGNTLRSSDGRFTLTHYENNVWHLFDKAHGDDPVAAASREICEQAARIRSDIPYSPSGS